MSNTTNTWCHLPIDMKNGAKTDLISLYGSCCSLCEIKLTWDELTVDHVLPISKGGPVSELSNLQLLCRKCHDEKTWFENKNR